MKLTSNISLEDNFLITTAKTMNIFLNKKK